MSGSENVFDLTPPDHTRPKGWFPHPSAERLAEVCDYPYRHPVHGHNDGSRGSGRYRLGRKGEGDPNRRDHRRRRSLAKRLQLAAGNGLG